MTALNWTPYIRPRRISAIVRKTTRDHRSFRRSRHLQQDVVRQSFESRTRRERIYLYDRYGGIETSGRQRAQNQGALKNFAEKTGGTFLATPGGIAMRDAFRKIVEELGRQYTLAYEPKNQAKDGKWRTIEVRVSKPNLTIRTRKGYNPQQVKSKK
jgi:VWFA-related protein